MHVTLAITTDVVDIHIEHVGVLLHLPPGHRHQAVPVFGVEQLAHLLGAARIEPFADDQKELSCRYGVTP